jgi:nucleoid-associated protein YgaU
VLYTADKPVWHTDTKGKKDVKLVLQDDRNLVLYAADGAAWSTKTETDAPPPAEETKAEAEAAPEAPAAPAAPAARKYTVVAGDTLSKIAKREYGDASKWHRIYEANKDTIKNPDLIYPGQTFKIPDA